MSPSPSASSSPSPRAPLRIGFLTNDFPLVSETFVVTWARGLAMRGHRVAVLAASGRGAGRLPEREILEGTEGRLTIHRPPTGAGLPAYLSEALRLRPVEATRLLASEGRPGPLRQAVARAPLAARLRPLDVVHCQFATLGLTALAMERLGALRTRALVVHARGYDVTKFVTATSEDVYRPLFARADLVVANSRHFQDRVIALGAPPARTVVIGSPIDTQRFAPPPQRPPCPPLRIVAVGRLVEKKGFADLIEAAGLLAARGTAFTLSVIGEGPLREALEARAAAVAPGRVSFRGAQPAAAVAQALRDAHLLVAPSVTAPDGDQDAPVNTLKEAMATGLPVIGTRHGGIPELIEDGVSGLLVPERDPGAIAEACAALLARRADWDAMGQAGRARVEATYGLGGVLAATEDAYAQALAQAAVRGRAG